MRRVIIPFVFYSVLIISFLWIMSNYKHTPVLSSIEAEEIDRFLEVENRLNSNFMDKLAKRKENKEENIEDNENVKVLNSIQYPKLYIDDQGEEVSYLQSLLNIEADGVFGSETYEKVIEFQQMNELIPDGIVGKATWEKLIETSHEKSAFLR